MRKGEEERKAMSKNYCNCPVCAKAALDAANSELTARDFSGGICAGSAGVGSFSEVAGWIDEAKKRLDAKTRECEKEHSELIRWMVQASEWCERHKSEKEKLEADNARLLAASNRIVELAQACLDNAHWEVKVGSGDLRNAINEWRQGESFALRDLLAPTIELFPVVTNEGIRFGFAWLSFDKMLAGSGSITKQELLKWANKASVELARLTALCETKKETET